MSLGIVKSQTHHLAQHSQQKGHQEADWRGKPLMMLDGDHEAGHAREEEAVAVNSLRQQCYDLRKVASKPST